MCPQDVFFHGNDLVDEVNIMFRYLLDDLPFYSEAVDGRGVVSVNPRHRDTADPGEVSCSYVALHVEVRVKMKRKP